MKNKKIFILENGKEVKEPFNVTPLIILLVIGLTLFSAFITDFDFSILIKRIDNFFDIIVRMIPPDIKSFEDIIKPLFETLAMSLIGTFIGAIVAIPAAVFASSNLYKKGIISTVFKFIFGVTRTLPTLIIALIAVFVFGNGSFAGTVAISIFTFSFVGKLLFQQIETADMGPYEALESMGATKMKCFISGIVPQILPSYFANTLYCFEGSVRHSAILGYVGAGGLGLILNEKIGWKLYDDVGMILLTLLVTVAIIEVINTKIRASLT